MHQTLSKGLNFAPYSSKKIGQVIFKHFEEFKRNLNWKMFHFENGNTDSVYNPKFKSKIFLEAEPFKVVENFCWDVKHKISEEIENVLKLSENQNKSFKTREKFSAK